MSHIDYTNEYPEVLSPDVAALCTSLEEDICSMDKVFDKTSRVRQQIIDRMETAVMVMKIDPDNEDAEQFEAKMRAVEALRGLLNDQEKNALNRTTVKLKKKDSDQAKALGLNIIDLMGQVNSMTTGSFSNKFQISHEDRDKLVQCAFDNGGTVIIEEELTDTSDVSQLSDVLAKEMIEGVIYDGPEDVDC